MTQEQVERMYGKIVFTSQDFVLRALVKADGLHVYAFRTENGSKLHELPRGFLLGSNTLHMSLYKAPNTAKVKNK